MTNRQALVLLALMAAAAAACDRAPTAPAVDIASVVESTNPALAADLKPIKSTLPALFREAIATTEAEQGHVGVDALLSNWHDLQNQLKDDGASAERAAIQAKVAAIHTEELKVVLRGLGQPVLTRVLSGLTIDLASAQSRIAAQLHDDEANRANTLATQVRQKLASARGAIVVGDNTNALDQATQAATLLSGLDYYLIEAQRIAGLEALYPRAVDQLKTASTNRPALDALAQVERNSAAAREALRDGNRLDAQHKLEQARAQQINVVLQVFGPQTATDLVHQVEERTSMLRSSLTMLEAGGQDITHYQHMLGEVNDLVKRARSAADAGDAASALDLGSHAAGMLNALQHLTWK